MLATGSVALAAPIHLDHAAQVSVSFVSSDAGATGSLYYLGYEIDHAITAPASSDHHNLGQFLFGNKGASAEHAVDLGVIPGGAALHFAYLITTGAGHAPTGSLFRSDLPDDQAYFLDLGNSTQDNVFTIGVEDIRDPLRSDFDFNDMIFQVRAIIIPGAPTGSIALLAAAGLLAAPRRRAC